MAHFHVPLIPEYKNSRIVSGCLNILFQSDGAAKQYNGGISKSLCYLRTKRLGKTSAHGRVGRVAEISLETSNLLADPAPNSTKTKGRGTL